MCFLSLVVGMIAGAGLVALIGLRLTMVDALYDLTGAVQKLHSSASHLQVAIAQLRQEWLAQQAQPLPAQKHRTTKGSKNGS